MMAGRPVAIRKRGAADNGLPCSLDAERFVLGAILLDDQAYAGALADLKPEDFTTEAHRRILRRASDLYGREERINMVTLGEELRRYGEAESVGGLSYITELSEGLPLIPSLYSYVRVLHEKAALRRVLFACDNLTSRVELGDTSSEITKAAEELFAGISAGAQSQTIAEIPAVSEPGTADVEYLRDPELPNGAVVALTGDAGCGKTTLASAWARDAIAHGVAVLILDRENPRATVVERNARLQLQDGPLYRHWGGWLPQQAPLPDAPVILDWVKPSEPKPLVIVDSLSGFFDGGDQNDAAEMRAFLHRCRRLADLGATVIPIHHSGKSESAQDYRGSSDFAAAIDAGYHVSNFGSDGRLGKLVLRPFKSRLGLAGELVYEYAGGRFVRGHEREATQSTSEQLTAILRTNPGITARKFDDLVNERGLGRNRARTFLADGVLSGSIRRETGPGKAKRYYLAVSDE